MFSSNISDTDSVPNSTLRLREKLIYLSRVSVITLGTNFWRRKNHILDITKKQYYKYERFTYLLIQLNS